MARHESTDTSVQDIRLCVAESVLQVLLPASCKLELNAKARMLSLLSTNHPHILAQEQFTKNEWSILLTLLRSYPYYALGLPRSDRVYPSFIDHITRPAQEIHAYDLSRPIVYQGPADEIGRLAMTFDHMLDRLEETIEREWPVSVFLTKGYPCAV
jgi:HAMP domain